MTDVVTGSLQVDTKRRTTLPGDILAAAGIPAGSPLVARVEEPGRIVLESPALLLALLQDDIAAALARTTDDTTDVTVRDGDDGSTDSAAGQTDGQLETGVGPRRDLVAELLAERAADASLTTDHEKQQDPQDEAVSTSTDEHGRHQSENSGDNHAAADPSGDSSRDLPHPRDGAA